MFTGIRVGTQSEKRGEAYVVQVPAYEMVLTTMSRVLLHQGEEQNTEDNKNPHRIDKINMVVENSN